MQTINVFLAIVVSLLMAGLVFEGGLRLIGMGPPSTLNDFDPQLGWSKVPGKVIERSTSEFDVTFEINELGLRGDPMSSPAKPANTFRVLVLGDSFALGYTVDREDLFVDQLEGWWQSESRRVDVINTGTEGYGTDQEVLWFLENGEKYDPDLVLILPFENDVYWASQESYVRFPKPRFGPDGTLEERTLVDPGDRSFIEGFAIGRLAKRQSADPANFVSVPGASRPIYGEHAVVLVDEPPVITDALARTKGALKALKRGCDALGAKLVMAPIPAETVIHENERARFQRNFLAGLPASAWDPNRPVDLYLQMGRELGIETLDARPYLQAKADAGERMYFDQEWHFTPAGNRAFAEFLHAGLDEAGAFPEAHSAIRAGGIPTSGETAGGVPTWLKVYGLLWLGLTLLYSLTYRDEPRWAPPLKIALLLAAVFGIVIGGGKLLAVIPPKFAQVALFLFVAGILGFIAYKLGRRLGTIAELFKAFTLRGHWYLMPLVVVLLTIGSLLVVAASSPLIAPFIYTLF